MRGNVSTAQPTSIDNSTTAEKLAEKADYLIRIEKFKTPKRLRALISTAVVALRQTSQHTYRFGMQQQRRRTQ